MKAYVYVPLATERFGDIIENLRKDVGMISRHMHLDTHLYDTIYPAFALFGNCFALAVFSPILQESREIRGTITFIRIHPCIYPRIKVSIRGQIPFESLSHVTWPYTNGPEDNRQRGGRGGDCGRGQGRRLRGRGAKGGQSLQENLNYIKRSTFRVAPD